MKMLLASMILALAAAGPGVPMSDGAMVCTITGQQVKECCCVEKDGKMICTLTGEVVTSCCSTRGSEVTFPGGPGSGPRPAFYRLTKISIG